MAAGCAMHGGEAIIVGDFDRWPLGSLGRWGRWGNLTMWEWDESVERGVWGVGFCV